MHTLGVFLVVLFTNNKQVLNLGLDGQHFTLFIALFALDSIHSSIFLHFLVMARTIAEAKQPTH